jgi:prephenate dehydratase
MRVAYLAPEGTFTWETAQLVARERGWPADTEFVPYPDGEAIVAAVARGEADFGVAAVATSLAGERGGLRRAAEQAEHVRIAGEHQRVCHYTLMAPAGASLQSLRTVRSVQKALDDCTGWLKAHLPGVILERTASTGMAAQSLAGSRDTRIAAVAPPAAAARHGLVALADNIEDDPENWTRWLILEHVG